MDSLEKIRKEVLKCEKCPLIKERKKNSYLPVVGQGRSNSRIMFVGEAPGLKEAETGKPFQGRAGKILDELLKEAGIEREEVYIANVLKDRPPGNRNPGKEEVRACGSFLDRQIMIIKPKTVCAMGNFSASYLFEKCGLKFPGISKARGRIYEGECGSGKIKIIPLYHPAAAIYNRSLENLMKRDFRKLKKIL